VHGIWRRRGHERLHVVISHPAADDSTPSSRKGARAWPSRICSAALAILAQSADRLGEGHLQWDENAVIETPEIVISAWHPRGAWQFSNLRQCGQR
jgi:hypothetical protein